MPTLPLYDPSPADPDAWHRVAAPGGYEWWYFDAEDAGSRVQVVAIFFEGFVFHPGYLRRYARYRRRPTRHRPPVAGEYPCAYLAAYEDGRVLAQFMSQYRPDEFSASDDRPDVRVGPNTMRRAADGAYRLHLAGNPWRLTLTGARRVAGQELSADLTFRPALPAAPQERTFLSRAMTGADHRWVVAAPVCAVEGTIRLGAASGSGNGTPGRVIPFAGRGYHDHNYGTAPIGPGLRRWVWGRLLTDEGGLTFRIATPRDPALPDEVNLLSADAGGVRELPIRSATVRWAGRSGTGLVYPTDLKLTWAGRGADELALTTLRVVDASPFYVRLQYAAALGAQSGTALCEVAYPHRLSWPVLGRMIEMSIAGG